MYPNPDLRIRKVFVEGNKRTSSSVFENELQGAYKAETLNSVKNELEVAAKELYQLDIFSSVDISMDKAANGNPKETDITIHVKEKNWWKLKVEGNTNGYEGMAETSFSLINPLGSASNLDVSYEQGYIGSHAIRGKYSFPRFFGLPAKLQAFGSNETIINEHLSSYNEKFRGGFLSLLDHSTKHDLQLHVGWRDIVPRRSPNISTGFLASRSIISEAIPSTKTSLKYIYNDDGRDNPTVPSKGSLFRNSSEIAGLFGDVRFLKNETSMEKHISFGPIWNGLPLLTLSLSSKFGAIKNYGSDSAIPTRISDRFFLGGPISLRGFNHRGIGPRSNPNEGGLKTGDALGGNILYSSLISLGFPIPISGLASFGFRGQLFASCGNVTSWDKILDSRKWLYNMVTDTRLSTGVGLVLGTTIGRIEANYSWVLRSKPEDRVNIGQIGMSASFS